MGSVRLHELRDSVTSRAFGHRWAHQTAGTEQAVWWLNGALDAAARAGLLRHDSLSPEGVAYCHPAA